MLTIKKLTAKEELANARYSNSILKQTLRNPPAAEIQSRKRIQLGGNNGLRKPITGADSFGTIIGMHTSVRHMLEQASRIAPLPITVLITGESGTGKELVAQLLHQASPRRYAPLITVNCSALPETLVESELFGYEKGAFTGAVSEKKGKFEMAQGGTLFLDEIGELSAQAQPKLLRALQDKEIFRLGGCDGIPVDVRVIAATNRNLEDEISRGNFREDLYYRLNVVELNCPPLRDRKEDIPALANHFIDRYSDKFGKPVQTISTAAMEHLCRCAWPGNIRELKNLIARAVALTITPVLKPEDFHVSQRVGEEAPINTSANHHANPFDTLIELCGLSPRDFGQDGWNRVMRGCERICLQAMLEQMRNQKETAEALGLTPTKLHRLIKKHGLNRFRNAFQN